MGVFGNSAVESAKALAKNNKPDPVKVWEASVARFSVSESSAKKGCPKNTFLSLLYAGKIKGLRFSAFWFSSTEREYALAACALLKEKPAYAARPTELWRIVCAACGKPNRNHQQEMDVVCALFNADMLNL